VFFTQNPSFVRNYERQSVTTEGNKSIIPEDWTVVLVGFIIIFFSLFLLVIPSPVYSWSTIQDLQDKVLSGSNLLTSAIQFGAVLIAGVIAAAATGRSARQFLYMFLPVASLTWLALILAGNSAVKGLNLEAVIFSLALGLVIGNFFSLPGWFRKALSTELFVKFGLVLLGTGVLFSDIVKAGSLGLLQALVVVVSVWYFAFWMCKRLKIDDELTMMLSSAVSICGVSAAIATAGAIKGDPKKLSYVISLVLITAIPMMLFMPYMAKEFGWSQQVTGAWLGGTIDTTGAVVASGTLVGDEALKISTIVKFSQNVLLGLAAFAISIYWTIGKKGSGDQRPTGRVIWDRFPKFVIGFLAASVMFSFFLSDESISTVKDSLKSIQTLWFVLAFTSIGLETKFADLAGQGGGKPLYAFLIAQVFNIIVTGVMAYVLFSQAG
jgi:uncharacterized integral membrane protein (TIGR00698 family)